MEIEEDGEFINRHLSRVNKLIKDCEIKHNSMTAKEKAQDLVNMYYAHARTQSQAIQIVDGVLLTTICQKIDDLHLSISTGDKDLEYSIAPRIQVLKWWQEVAYEVGQLKMKLPV